MRRFDPKLQRLFIDAPFDDAFCIENAPDNMPAPSIPLSQEQSHYLINVLRKDLGDELLIFNGKTGEYRARISEAHKKHARLELLKQTRTQSIAAPITYCFAPLKSARLDYLVQKAVEMGVAALQPIITARTQGSKLSYERVEANIIEAAEQCGILNIPVLKPALSLAEYITRFAEAPLGMLIFCDEEAEETSAIQALSTIPKSTPIALLIGPEGGFDDQERIALIALPNIVRLSLGARILRADTAAVAALALIQATCGDAA